MGRTSKRGASTGTDKLKQGTRLSQRFRLRSSSYEHVVHRWKDQFAASKEIFIFLVSRSRYPFNPGPLLGRSSFPHPQNPTCRCPSSVAGAYVTRPIAGIPLGISECPGLGSESCTSHFQSVELLGS